MGDRRYASSTVLPRAALLAIVCLTCLPVEHATAGGGRIQKSAESVQPSPRRAAADRGEAYHDGCHVDIRATSSPACVYGDPRSSTTVVLFGDSHALHLFPALHRVADRRGWRLVSLTKSGCPPADVDVYNRRVRRFYPECGAWRDAMLRRIAVEEKPAVVVTSGSIYTAVMQDGERIPPPQGREILALGAAAVAKRLVAGGAHVLAIRDVPKAPFDIPQCVAAHMRHLRRCAFSRRDALPDPDRVSDALRGIDGVRLLDAAKKLCLRRLCPAVIDDLLVYRDRNHLTATFAATLAPWLGHKLRDLP